MIGRLVGPFPQAALVQAQIRLRIEVQAAELAFAVAVPAIGEIAMPQMEDAARHDADLAAHDIARANPPTQEVGRIFRRPVEGVDYARGVLHRRGESMGHDVIAAPGQTGVIETAGLEKLTAGRPGISRVTVKLVPADARGPRV